MKIILCGCNGKMGKYITQVAKNSKNIEIVAGIDKNNSENENFPVFTSLDKVNLNADILIDFSHPSALDGILEYCSKKEIPAVICTTGFSSLQIEKIKEYSKEIALFYSQNMSLGINLLINLTKKATEFLGTDFNIEIIEKHHNQKIDSPSGTALMIANEISECLPDKPLCIFDRSKSRAPRSKNEIGIHSIRAGNICGDHEVIFAGENEIITISHHAQSRNIFAEGAIKAAEFLMFKSPGLYTMQDMVECHQSLKI